MKWIKKYFKYIWPFLLMVLSIGIASYINNKEREPVYAYKYPPSLIYNKEAVTPKIKLIREDSLLIEENVYITNIVLWNKGELPIDKDDIRLPIRFKMSGEGEILDFKIIDETHPEISKFKLVKDADCIKVDYQYFDPNFGLEIQLVYSGNDSSSVIVEGVVLDNSIKLVEPKTGKGDSLYLIIILFFMLLGTFIGIYFIITRKDYIVSKLLSGYIWEAQAIAAIKKIENNTISGFKIADLFYGLIMISALLFVFGYVIYKYYITYDLPL